MNVFLMKLKLMVMPHSNIFVLHQMIIFFARKCIFCRRKQKLVCFANPIYFFETFDLDFCTFAGGARCLPAPMHLPRSAAANPRRAVAGSKQALWRSP
jgi:hypothetical protein